MGYSDELPVRAYSLAELTDKLYDAARFRYLSPALSWQALQWWFVGDDGQPYRVGSAPFSVLIAFIERCLLQTNSKARTWLRRDMETAFAIDDDHSRWYMLSELAEHRKPLPLYKSKQEALASLHYLSDREPLSRN